MNEIIERIMSQFNIKHIDAVEIYNEIERQKRLITQEVATSIKCELTKTRNMQDHFIDVINKIVKDKLE